MQPGPTTVAETTEEAVLRLALTVNRRFRMRSDSDGVDPSQATVLYTLKCRGALRLGDLADAMQLDASTVSRHVQQLSDRGLLDRGPDPEDGRARIIELTPAGAACLRHSFDQRKRVVTEALEGWDEPSRAQLRDLLVRLTSSLEQP
jgi:DNA-binding MarR family transcriptional regulator